MGYHDLRGFLRDLEAAGDLKRVRVPVDPVLEVTEICQRTLKANGPALLFESPQGARMPLLGNLFGTTARVARAVGRERPIAARDPQIGTHVKSGAFPGS